MAARTETLLSCGAMLSHGWHACLFPCIRAHRMGLVEAAPAPAMPWLRQAHYCTIGSSSAVCGGTCGACTTSVWLTPSTLQFPTPAPVHAWPHPNAPLNATRQRKPKDATWDFRNCGIAQDCSVTWGHIGQGVQTGSTARPARPNSIRQHH